MEGEQGVGLEAKFALIRARLIVSMHAHRQALSLLFIPCVIHRKHLSYIYLVAFGDIHLFEKLKSEIV